MCGRPLPCAPICVTVLASQGYSMARKGRAVGERLTLKPFGLLVGVFALSMVAMASPALAQVGLPPGYDVQRINPPNPELGGNFGSGMASAGDVNGDGEDDLLTHQLAGSPGEDGEVYVISGETGALIDTILAPDQDTDATGTTPAPGDNQSNFGFPWMSKLGTNRGNSPANFTDLASCPGASAANDVCPGTIGPPDGIPEILVGARGVDAKGVIDSGRAYIFDGGTRALLKRIDMPAAEAAAAVARGTAAVRAGGTWFGRSVLNPAGQPGCAGNSSVGPCQAVPRSVEIGDMDGGGRPDIIVGASATTESTGAAGSAYPTSQCAAATAGGFCTAAGRAYIYRGEDIVGSSPQEILDGTVGGQSGSGPEVVRQLRNPHAQSAGGSQLFANSLTAIGDVGSCNAAVAAGDRCPDAASSSVPDGRPEVVVGALRVDLPFNAPGAPSTDEGVSFLVDGATGAFLHTYQSPEPQASAVFGSQFQQPAAGDLGASALPDAYIASSAHDVPGAPTGGRGYVFNGDFKSAAALISELRDPTPHETENFGYASVGVGNLVGGVNSPRNELLVGSEGPFFTDRPASDPAPAPPNDLHFFNGATGRVLQTVSDPDNQPGSAFGGGIAGLGDLDEDGFLDFAVAASLFSTPGGIGEGRMYIFRSRAPATRPVTRPRSALPTFADCPALTANVIQGNAAGGRITGTVRGDRIFGGTGNDIVDGLAGDDCIDLGPGTDSGQGGLGSDLLLGGLGVDRMSGNEGNDRLRGGSSADRLIGGFGNDRLHGQSGSDRVNGERGRDRINGGSSNDVVSGGSSGDRIAGDQGKDRLNGNSGNDSIRGNSGNDRITGSSGRDRLSGGGGRDRIAARDGRGGDRIACGLGRDSVVADRGDRVARDCERVSRRR